MRTALLFAALVTVSACQQQAATPPAKPDTAAASDAIRMIEEGQIAAIKAKDAAGSSGLYGKDAVFIGDKGEAVTGSEAIAGMFQKLVTDPALTIDYQPGTKTFSDDGTMAYSTATFTERFTDTATGKPVTIKGTNLSVWRRQADGSWKLVADSNPAAITG